MAHRDLSARHQSMSSNGPAAHTRPTQGSEVRGDGSTTSGAETPLPVAPTINPTPNLVVTATVAELRSLFAKYVREAGAYERLRRKEMNVSTSRTVVDDVLAARLENIGEMSSQDFVDAFTLFDEHDWTRRDEESRERVRRALRLDAVGETRGRMSSLRPGLKYVYSKLWIEGAVLFPLHFRMGRTFHSGEVKKILPPVVTCHTDANDAMMGAFGFTLTLASSWRSFSDIDLDAFGAYEHDLCSDFRKREILGARRGNPYSPFTATLWTWYHAGKDDGFPYSEDEIRGYLYWMDQLRRGKTDKKPSEYIPTILESRKETLVSHRLKADRRHCAAQIDLLDHPRKTEFKAAILAGEMSARDVRFKVAHDEVASPDDILGYARLIRSKRGKRQNGVLYPARMHAYPSDVWAKWNDIFERFLEFRKRQGYESVESFETFRYVLQDYICCYLPWWIELSPGAGFAPPSDPSLLTRFGAWVEGDARPAPLPLLRFFDRTRDGSSPDGFNSFVSNAHTFWDFCRAEAQRLGLARTDEMDKTHCAFRGSFLVARTTSWRSAEPRLQAPPGR
ncbi:hypothetical protein HPY26_10575, partial [Methylorubrum rhodesianum]